MAIDEELAEQLSRKVHQNYFDDQVRRGRPVDGTGAMRPWDQLTEDLKLANRAQVDDILAKLDQIGCDVRAAPYKRPFALTDHEVEQLARREHDRWCTERTSRGWRRGLVRDDAKRVHPS